ncbi:unnamed protein product [Natator depressus]
MLQASPRAAGPLQPPSLSLLPFFGTLSIDIGEGAGADLCLSELLYEEIFPAGSSHETSELAWRGTLPGKSESHVVERQQQSKAGIRHTLTTVIMQPRSILAPAGTRCSSGP